MTNGWPTTTRREAFNVLHAGLWHRRHTPAPVARGAVVGLAQGVWGSAASQGCGSPAVHGVSAVGDIGLSTVTLVEPQYGVAKSRFPAQNQQALDAFTLPLEVVVFDAAAAAAYGPVRATLERQGTPIGALDLLIAAHALSLGVILVTNNPRGCSRVPGLRVENWV